MNYEKSEILPTAVLDANARRGTIVVRQFSALEAHVESGRNRQTNVDRRSPMLMRSASS